MNTAHNKVARTLSKGSARLPFALLLLAGGAFYVAWQLASGPAITLPARTAESVKTASTIAIGEGVITANFSNGEENSTK